MECASHVPTSTAGLQRATTEAGAEFIEGRADTPITENGRVSGFALSSSTRIQADVIVKKLNGATSPRRYCRWSRRQPAHVLWGFTARTYIDEEVSDPYIMVWAPEHQPRFPATGGYFRARTAAQTSPGGRSARRPRGRPPTAIQAFESFRWSATGLGVLGQHRGSSRTPLGAWLKLGMVGTVPHREHVLLVGDAAGLVNPFQGEGIAQAMGSGAAAAQPRSSPARGTRTTPIEHHSPTATRRISQRPHHCTVFFSHDQGSVAYLTRALTAPGIGHTNTGGWAIAWNDLLNRRATQRRRTDRGHRQRRRPRRHGNDRRPAVDRTPTRRRTPHAVTTSTARPHEQRGGVVV